MHSSAQTAQRALPKGITWPQTNTAETRVAAPPPPTEHVAWLLHWSRCSVVATHLQHLNQNRLFLIGIVFSAGAVLTGPESTTASYVT